MAHAEPGICQTLRAWTFDRFNVTGGDTPQRVMGSRVSADFSHAESTTRARTRLSPGRRKAQRRARGHDQLRFLAERYNSDPEILSKSIDIEGEPYAIVGVMPDEFHFLLMGRANIWIPLVLTDKERTDHDTGWLNVLGRMKPGVATATAQQAMSGIAAGLEKQYPDTN